MLLRAPICFSFSEILYIYTPACHISTKISTHVMRINQIVSLHGPDNLRSHHEHCWVPKSAPILRNLAFHFAVGVANKANNQNLVGYKKKVIRGMHLIAVAGAHAGMIRRCFLRVTVVLSFCRVSTHLPRRMSLQCPPLDPTSWPHEETMKHASVVCLEARTLANHWSITSTLGQR